MDSGEAEELDLDEEQLEKGAGFLAGVQVLEVADELGEYCGKLLAGLGADVIKVEPPGGRAERERLREPWEDPDGYGRHPERPDRSDFFSEMNAGKRGISLNLRHPPGKALPARLLRMADVVAEGFTPGTMDRLGFGYARLREWNPGIIYVQQSGMGQIGRYGRMRSYGPIAAAFAGTSEMSGLPEPYPPAGIGYSYLDWFGAYNLANGILAALYRKQATGEGC
jgi:crotonobetainyl-CoA:carnitine CoA-transferase CaiB-like acyl-CoA transferase